MRLGGDVVTVIGGNDLAHEAMANNVTAGEITEGNIVDTVEDPVLLVAQTSCHRADRPG